MFRHQFTSLALVLSLIGPAALAETTLRFSWWGGTERHQVTQKAIALFESRNPGVKIKAEFGAFRGYEAKLNDQIASGSQPDIMQANWAWLPRMVRQQDALLDLYKHRSLLSLDAFASESYKAGLVNGRLAGLPTSYTANVFLWNKTAFNRAGIPLPKTWDQLIEAGRLFKSKLGDEAYPLASDSQTMVMISHAYIHQKTGKPYIYSNQAKVALNQEELREWLGFYRTLLQNHVFMSSHEKSEKRLTGKTIEQLSEWSTGKWAGHYTWDSTLRLRQNGWAVGTQGEIGSFLTMSGARNSGMYGRPSTMLVASKNSKHPELAVKFINFMTTDPEAAKILGMSRGTPMAKTQFDVLQKGNLIQGLELKAYQQIMATRLEYPSPLFEHSKMQVFLRKTFDAFAKGTISEDQAATLLLSEGNQILKSIK